MDEKKIIEKLRKKCKRCGKVFFSLRSVYCLECKDEMRREYMRRYMREYYRRFWKKDVL